MVTEVAPIIEEELRTSNPLPLLTVDALECSTVDPGCTPVLFGVNDGGSGGRRWGFTLLRISAWECVGSFGLSFPVILLLRYH